MPIKSLKSINVNINAYYPDIIKAINEKIPFKKFSFFYNIFTGVHDLSESNENYWQWIDYLLDSYSKYKKYGFNDFESQVNSLMDGLEGLLK